MAVQYLLPLRFLHSNRNSLLFGVSSRNPQRSSTFTSKSSPSLSLSSDREESRWVREEQRWIREEQRWIREEKRWNSERVSLLRQIDFLTTQLERPRQHRDSTKDDYDERKSKHSPLEMEDVKQMVVAARVKEEEVKEEEVKEPRSLKMGSEGDDLIDVSEQQDDYDWKSKHPLLEVEEDAKEVEVEAKERRSLRVGSEGDDVQKPTAVNVAELDVIIQACEVNGVQFMDGTMFMHHPRTEKMKEVISDPWRFGDLKMVHSNFAYRIAPSLLRDNIRTKPDLDGLGALGDAGWYCIRAILWGADYKLPNKVVANRNPTFNESGVIMSCGASLLWDDGLIATFDCSFQSRISMDLCVAGTNGIIHLNDFVIPFDSSSASFTFSTNASFTDPANAGRDVDFADPVVAWHAAGYGSTGWQHPLPSEQVVRTEMPQETRMVEEFSKLVAGIKYEHRLPEMKWAVIARKTQLVVDAVKASIENDFTPVDIQG